MKNINRKILFLLHMLLAFSLVFSVPVFAEEEKQEVTVSQTFIGEYGQYDMRKSGLPRPFQHSWAKYHYFTADNQTPVYCIDFSVPHLNGIYQVEKEGAQFSKIQKENITLALSYGYNGFGGGYPDYDTNIQRIATQICIWLIQGDVFNTPQEAAVLSKFTEKSPFQKQIQEVFYFLKQDVLTHSVVPSFAGTTVTLAPNGKGNYTATLVDENECMEQFAVMAEAIYGIGVEMEGNRCILTSQRPVEEEATIMIPRKATQGSYAAVEPLFLTKGTVQAKVMPSPIQQEYLSFTVKPNKKTDGADDTPSSEPATPETSKGEESPKEGEQQKKPYRNQAITFAIPPIIHDTKSLVLISLVGAVFFGGAMVVSYRFKK